jgi:type IV pilus assembly protein PilN
MIKVNLLSPEKKDLGGGGGDAPSFSDEEREQKINTVAAIAAAVLTVGIIGYLYFTQAATLEERENTLVERRARKAQLDIVLQTLDELEKAKKLLDRKVKLIADLKSRQQDTVKMMDQLSNALPDWVWITSVTFSGKLLSINGTALSNNLISDFINNLKGTGSFYDVEFPGSQRRKKENLDIFNFRLTSYYRDKDKKPEQPANQQKGRRKV